MYRTKPFTGEIETRRVLCYCPVRRSEFEVKIGNSSPVSSSLTIALPSLSSRLTKRRERTEPYYPTRDICSFGRIGPSVSSDTFLTRAESTRPTRFAHDARTLSRFVRLLGLSFSALFSLHLFKLLRSRSESIRKSDENARSNGNKKNLANLEPLVSQAYDPRRRRHSSRVYGVHRAQPFSTLRVRSAQLVSHVGT